ncbi:hypothetical protein [Granulicella mallensis]|uniref:Uncharacterized protein n=1 Tax=Granulicella mallensis TaxID=940614 RepID=A0A7W7ZU01_9BACT|nr:hypothetical protein [Granulicella mallensis]MBB5066144.1 hypothetical protein [Granulicella mallensis]
MSENNQVAGTVGKDPTLPDVSLILNGVERHLCYDFNAIAQAEIHTGINLLRNITDVSATNLRALLWAALLKENPKLTIEEVGSWITLHKVPAIHNAIITAWFGSLDEPEPKGEDAGE